jgi:hypothetical protein
VTAGVSSFASQAACRFHHRSGSKERAGDGTLEGGNDEQQAAPNRGAAMKSALLSKDLVPVNELRANLASRHGAVSFTA